MFEDLMSLMAGFLTAYLILRAVRSFRGGVGVLALFLGVPSVFGAYANLTINIGNYPGGSPTYSVYVNNTTGCNLQVGAWSGSGNPGTATWAINYSYPYATVYGNGKIAGSVDMTSLSGTIYLDWTGASCQPGYLTYTNYYVSTNFVTPGGSNVLSDQYATVNLWTNGVLAQSLQWDIGPGGSTNSMILTNPISGYSGPFTYSITAPGNGTNDWVPIQVGTNAATGSTGLSLYSATNQDSVAWQNPVRNIPQDPSVTNLNSQIQSQIQNQSLLNQVGNLQGAMQAGDRAVTNLLSSINSLLSTNAGGGTNVSDAGTHSALGVVTNQLGALQGLSSNLNLGLMGNGSNVGGLLPSILSNTMSPLAVDVSNALYVAAHNDWLLASNVIKSGWSSEMGGIQGTNSTVQTNVDMPGGEGNLTVSLAGPGHTFVVDFNPFHLTEGPWLAFLQAIPWIRYWTSWAIAFAVWWLCVQRLDELVVSGSLAAAMAGKGSSGSAAGYGIKLVAGPFVAVLVTAAVASLPTAAMAWMTTRGITNPLSAPSFLGTLGDIGPMGSSFTVMIEEFAGFLLVVWPIDVALVGFANWVTFYFMAGFFYRMMTAALRCMGMYVPLLVFGCFAVHGEQIRFENFTGSAVVVSNGARVLSLPPGVSDKMVIPYGNWITASNGFTVNADGYQVVRAYGDTNNVGVVYFEQADGYSAYQWWMWGMNCGFLIFGTTWAVSAARSGILLRVRE